VALRGAAAARYFRVFFGLKNPFRFVSNALRSSMKSGL